MRKQLAEIEAEPDPIRRWAKTFKYDEEHIFDCFETGGIRQAVYVETDKHFRFRTYAVKNRRIFSKQYMLPYRDYTDCAINLIRVVGDAELAAISEAIA